MEDDNIYVTQRTQNMQHNLNVSEFEFDMDISYQSLPSNNISGNMEIVVKNEEITKLKLELQSANSKIDNLNLENLSLKDKIKKYESKIKIFKSVGLHDPTCTETAATPIRFYSPQYQRRLRTITMKTGLPRTSSREFTMHAITSMNRNGNKSEAFIHKSPIGNNSDKSLVTGAGNLSPTNSYKDLQVCSTQNSPTSIAEEQENGGIPTHTSTDREIQGTSKIMSLSTPKQNMGVTGSVKSVTEKRSCKQLLQGPAPKHKIAIFADQTGYEIRDILQNLVGNSFSVTSVIKPNAPLSYILSTCETMCKDFTKSDFVLIIGGISDKNPLDVLSSLHHTLKNIQNTNVLVGKIYKNKYLNVSNVNSTLKLVCNNCENSIFITLDDYNYANYNNRPLFNKLTACKLIYRDILRLQYRINYQNYVHNVLIDQKAKRIFKNVSTQTIPNLVVKASDSNRNNTTTPKVLVNSATQTELNSSSITTDDNDLFRD